MSADEKPENKADNKAGAVAGTVVVGVVLIGIIRFLYSLQRGGWTSLLVYAAWGAFAVLFLTLFGLLQKRKPPAGPTT